MEENKKPGAGFEETDINEFAVGRFGVALVLITILAMAVLFGLFNYFKSASGGQAANVNPRTMFPEPKLEERPIQELNDMHEAEKQALKSYGWADQSKGQVRIPIDRAMELILQKGLPVRPPVAPNPAAVSVPTESGLGPKMQQPGGPLGEGK